MTQQAPPLPRLGHTPTRPEFASWRSALRRAVDAQVTDFVHSRCAVDLSGSDGEVIREVLLAFLDGGKGLRSTFLYLGWLCDPRGDDGRDDEAAGAVVAAGSMELLHAFALLQDDVMDDSPLRRGRPSAHVRFAEWHRRKGFSGAPERFGGSAAVLLGDLCLVWAERMLRESGLAEPALARAWPRYDHMRTELAVGQFADLVNDAGRLPTVERVLDVARRKSGHYTVRRPLEIGGALADCPDAVLTALGLYGDAIGEAFQLRDDLLGVFGSPEVTGKPAGSDLLDRKATSVVAAAHRLADAAARREMAELVRAETLDGADVRRWRALIAASGAPEWLERLIDERVSRACTGLDGAGVPEPARAALVNMAAVCTDRAA